MTFSNEYTILGELGKGGFAKVFKVRHNELGYLRAIRVLNEPITDEHSDTYKKFLRECKVLLRLGNGNHRNIVHIYQPRLLENHALVEMDFVDGMDISHYLKDNGNFLPVSEVLQMVNDISSALSYCHEDIYKFCIDPDEDQLESDPFDGSKWMISDDIRRRLISKYKVIHNDIHSGNIMRREDGSFVLLDFGLSIDGGEVIKRGSSRHDNGAPEYMSPEKWDDETVLSEQSDIYSFGVVMYEYLAGRVPFICKGNSFNDRKMLYEAIKNKTKIPSITDLRRTFFEKKYDGEEYKKDFPDWLEEVILKCLEIDPTKRFRNGKELKEFIERHQESDLSLSTKTIEDLQASKDALRLKVEYLEEKIKNLQDTTHVVSPPIEELGQNNDEFMKIKTDLINTKNTLNEKDKEIEILRKQCSGKKNKVTIISLSTFFCILALALILGLGYYRNNSESSSDVSWTEVKRLNSIIESKDKEIIEKAEQIVYLQDQLNSSNDAVSNKLRDELKTANSTIATLKSQLKGLTKERDKLLERINDTNHAIY